MSKITKINVGVDVSKNTLSICFHESRKFFELENSTNGISCFIQGLSGHSVDKVVFEASGGYEEALMAALLAAGYTCERVDPRIIKGFIASMGCKAKTDKIDAKMIALFAHKKDANLKHDFSNEHTKKLRDFFRRKQEIKDMIIMEKLRLGKPTQKYFNGRIKKVICFLEKEIKILDKEILLMLEESTELVEKRNIIESIPGVGTESAVALLAEMPELGKIKNKEAGALLGVVPYSKESGIYKGKSKIKDGRAMPRKVLYMASLAACRFNPDFSKFYNRLRQSGKPAKVAIVAVMRKLVALINTLLKEERLWVSFN